MIIITTYLNNEVANTPVSSAKLQSYGIHNMYHIMMHSVKRCWASCIYKKQ